MHDLMFRFKRAHLTGVAFGKKILKKFGLTPARFDVLWVVVGAGPTGVLQSDIWERLGLHKTTISKMCKRLEQLGLIRRCNAARAPRHELSVQLTIDGLMTLGKALHFVFRTQGMRFATRVVMSNIEPDVDAFISKLRRLTERAARNLGDTSTLLYPLHPPRESTIEKVFKRMKHIYAARWEQHVLEKQSAERMAAHQKKLLEKDDDDYGDGEH